MDAYRITYLLSCDVSHDVMMKCDMMFDMVAQGRSASVVVNFHDESLAMTNRKSYNSIHNNHHHHHHRGIILWYY